MLNGLANHRGYHFRHASGDELTEFSEFAGFTELFSLKTRRTLQTHRIRRTNKDLGGRIRTCEYLLPKQARIASAEHPGFDLGFRISDVFFNQINPTSDIRNPKST
jgi:hypothetical protein